MQQQKRAAAIKEPLKKNLFYRIIITITLMKDVVNP